MGDEVESNSYCHLRVEIYTGFLSSLQEMVIRAPRLQKLA